MTFPAASQSFARRWPDERKRSSRTSPADAATRFLYTVPAWTPTRSAAFAFIHSHPTVSPSGWVEMLGRDRRTCAGGGVWRLQGAGAPRRECECEGAAATQARANAGSLVLACGQ